MGTRTKQITLGPFSATMSTPGAAVAMTGTGPVSYQVLTDGGYDDASGVDIEYSLDGTNYLPVVSGANSGDIDIIMKHGSHVRGNPAGAGSAGGCTIILLEETDEP